jgi:hypothetical protein
MEEEALAALEHFKKKLIDPLQKRMDLNHDFIFGGGYEKQCKEKNVDPLKSKIESMKKAYDKETFVLNESKKVYKAVLSSIEGHRATISPLLEVYVNMRDKIVSEGVFPTILMEEQAEMMTSYYEEIEKLVKKQEFEKLIKELNLDEKQTKSTQDS